MHTNTPVDATLKQFVLGSLDEQRRLELEERLVTDPDTFEALELVEEELVESYAEGTLSGADRQGFERHYLTTPERCRQVAFVRLLHQRAVSERTEKTTTPVRRWFDWRISVFWAAPLAASLCVAVGGSAWLAARQAGLRDELRGLDAQRQAQALTAQQLLDDVGRLSARTNELEALLGQQRGAGPATGGGTLAQSPAALAAARPQSASPFYDLSAGVLRDSGTRTRVPIPPLSAGVHFRLALAAADYPSYRATIHNDDGDELCSVSKLVPQTVSGARVLLFAPCTLLGRGDYEIRVSGVAADGRSEVVATYSFRTVG